MTTSWIRSSRRALALVMVVIAAAACGASGSDPASVTTDVAATTDTSGGSDALGADTASSDANAEDSTAEDTAAVDTWAGSDAGAEDTATLDDTASLEDTAPSPDATTGCVEADCAKQGDQCHTATCVDGACVIQVSDGACDDGNPCTSSDYCTVGTCLGFAIQGCCKANCDGKVCGSDGCSGSCGSCSAGTTCGGSGQCEATTNGADTCGGATAIVGLPASVTGTTVGLSDDYMVPAQACNVYTLGQYQRDAVYRYIATFTGFLTVTLTGLEGESSVYVASDCNNLKYSCSVGTTSTFGEATLPIQAPVETGKTYYIVVENAGDGGTFTLGLDACLPDCDGKECGVDGCGHWCATCPVLSAYECASNDTCVCLPSCDGKICGDDGCGGSCGECGVGKTCDALGDLCVSAPGPGDTCADAIVMDTFPFTYSGTTTGYGNDYYAWAFCKGNSIGAYLGYDAPDRVFSVQPSTPTTYYVEIAATGYIPSLWAVTDCNDPRTCVQAGYQPLLSGENLLIEAGPEAPTFFMASAYPEGDGPFTLKATACSTPESCPEVTPGETCSFAREILFLPFSTTEPWISSGVDVYHLPDTGLCASTKSAGDGVNEDAYVFTPIKSGPHTVTVTATGQLDPVLYVATDCRHLDTACLGSADATGEASTETITFDAIAGQPTFVVVDGFTPYGGGYTLSVSGPP